MTHWPIFSWPRHFVIWQLTWHATDALSSVLGDKVHIRDQRDKTQLEERNQALSHKAKIAGQIFPREKRRYCGS